MQIHLNPNERDILLRLLEQASVRGPENMAAVLRLAWKLGWVPDKEFMKQIAPVILAARENDNG